MILTGAQFCKKKKKRKKKKASMQYFFQCYDNALKKFGIHYSPVLQGFGWS